jgi:hypothetical protein
MQAENCCWLPTRRQLFFHPLLRPVSEDLPQRFVDESAVKGFVGCEPAHVEQRLEDRGLVSFDPEDGSAAPDAVPVLLLPGHKILSPSYSRQLGNCATDVAESRYSIHVSGCNTDSRTD